MANFDLKRQSPGERLWVDRTRLGKTQAEMALVFDTSERRYNMYERDKVEFPWAPPPTTTDRGLLCALARRRHGLCLRSTASLFNISHTELLTRERESDPRLVREWKSLKYRF